LEIEEISTELFKDDGFVDGNWAYKGNKNIYVGCCKYSALEKERGMRCYLSSYGLN
jgi:hypothetical protein